MSDRDGRREEVAGFGLLGRLFEGPFARRRGGGGGVSGLSVATGVTSGAASPDTCGAIGRTFGVGSVTVGSTGATWMGRRGSRMPNLSASRTAKADPNPNDAARTKFAGTRMRYVTVLVGH